jgi:hypothetical protein
MTKHLSLPENPTTAGCVDPRKAAKTTHVREVLWCYISRFRPRQAPFSDAARTRARPLVSVPTTSNSVSSNLFTEFRHEVMASAISMRETLHFSSFPRDQYSWYGERLSVICRIRFGPANMKARSTCLILRSARELVSLDENYGFTCDGHHS